MVLTEAQDLFALFFAIYFAVIIDRSNELYRPWDTYNAWKGKPHNIRRLLAALILLFAIPLLHLLSIDTAWIDRYSIRCDNQRHIKCCFDRPQFIF